MVFRFFYNFSSQGGEMSILKIKSLEYAQEVSLRTGISLDEILMAYGILNKNEKAQLGFLNDVIKDNDVGKKIKVAKSWVIFAHLPYGSSLKKLFLFHINTWCQKILNKAVEGKSEKDISWVLENSPKNSFVWREAVKKLVNIRLEKKE
ncbi:hypothetical protein ACFLY7_02375 [Patescibacteria group bacterium]